MAQTGWILTLGSARQSQEFVQSVGHHGWQVRHVVEEAAPWSAKPFAQLLSEAEAVCAAMPVPPRAVINFGRASVPYGIDTIARCSEVLRERWQSLSIIGPSFRAAEIFSDKWLIYQEMTGAGFPCPLTIQVDPNAIDETERLLQAQGFPLPAILKVTDLTGGSGMEYIASPGALRPAFERLRFLDRPLILTQFVQGDEISFDVLRLGTDCLVFPAGVKTATDERLTHADHKIKVNGYTGPFLELEEQIRQIAATFDLQGFFSIEGVVLDRHPIRWTVLEAATRVTNNFPMQNASLQFDSFLAVSLYLHGQPWLPDRYTPMVLAFSLPVYEHRGEESLAAVQSQSWVLQAKLENLAEMPLSRDQRVRLTVKFMGEPDLDQKCRVLEEATGDLGITGRIFGELDRQRLAYALATGNTVQPA